MHSHLNRLAGRPPPLAKPTDSQATSHLQRWEGMLHRAACLQFNQCAFLVFGSSRLCLYSIKSVAHLLVVQPVCLHSWRASSCRTMIPYISTRDGRRQLAGGAAMPLPLLNPGMKAARCAPCSSLGGRPAHALHAGQPAALPSWSRSGTPNQRVIMEPTFGHCCCVQARLSGWLRSAAH